MSKQNNKEQLIEEIITANNPAATDDVLVEKLEDINEIEKAEEELSKRSRQMDKFNEIFPNVRRMSIKKEQLREEFNEKFTFGGRTGIIVFNEKTIPFDIWDWIEAKLAQNTLETLERVEEELGTLDSDFNCDHSPVTSCRCAREMHMKVMWKISEDLEQKKSKLKAGDLT